VRTDAWHTSCLCRYANALAATQLIAKRQENEVAAPAAEQRMTHIDMFKVIRPRPEMEVL